MPKFLINWKVNPQMMPTSPEECIKLLQSMNEMVRAGIKSGEIADWGEYCDGSGGYAIGEADDVTEFYAALMRWRPYVDFDAKPVLSIDQVIQATNSVVAEAKSK
jgi:hypothetical protein